MADEGFTVSAEDSADSVKKSALGAMKLFTGKVLESANKAADSSKDYLHKTKENIEVLTHKAKDSSKEYLEKAKGKIEDLTQKAKDSSTTTNGATHLGEGTSSEQDEPLSFPLSILAWCSTLCSKTTSSAPRSFEVSSLATNEQLSDAAQNLEESREALRTQAEETHETVAKSEESVETKLESSQPAEKDS